MEKDVNILMKWWRCIIAHLPLSQPVLPPPLHSASASLTKLARPFVLHEHISGCTRTPIPKFQNNSIVILLWLL